MTSNEEDFLDLYKDEEEKGEEQEKEQESGDEPEQKSKKRRRKKSKPETPEASQTSQTPETPQTPQTPETPVFPTVPKSSEVPVTPLATSVSPATPVSTPTLGRSGQSFAKGGKVAGKAALAGADQIKDLASQGLNIGWDGMKVALSPFLSDETSEKMEKIENGVRGGIDGINNAINAPREMVERVQDMASLPKRIQDTVKTVTELPQRIQQVQQILQNAKSVNDVVNAYHTLTMGGEAVATGTGTGTGAVATGTGTGAVAAGTGTSAVAAGTAGTAGTTGVAAGTTGVAAGTGTGAVAAGAAAGASGVATGVTTTTAVTATTTAGTAAVAAGEGVSGPPGWILLAIELAIILVIIGICCLFFWLIYVAGSINYISSLFGGSFDVATRYTNKGHQELVISLLGKTEGCDPVLVIYDEGGHEIDWQQDKEENFYHSLDHRILKTLDYLTDNHRIKVGLLMTGAPLNTVEKKISGWRDFGEEGNPLLDNWDEMDQEEKADYLSGLSQEEREILYVSVAKEYRSAYTLGHAMAIIEIDRSRIPEMQGYEFNKCAQLVAAPIAVSWQKTLSEKEIRSDWEELTYTAGILDEKIIWLQNINGQEEVIQNVAVKFYNDINAQRGVLNLAEFINKINRLVEVLGQLPSRSYHSSLHDVTKEHYANALADLSFVANIFNISDPYDMDEINNIPEENLIQMLTKVSTEESVGRIIRAIRGIYKGSQVANMVGWEDGELEYRKAYEARNKIREVIAELVAMPVYADLNEENFNKLGHFDNNLVIKQLITFSPEDDLDNGKVGLDVFPFGIEGVGIEGISMNDSGIDGVSDYKDLHFSHKPVDNGVFSKHGSNFIYYEDDENINIINRFLDYFSGTNDEWFSNALDGEIFVNLEEPVEEQVDIEEDIEEPELKRIIKRITFEKMLHVAF